MADNVQNMPSTNRFEFPEIGDLGFRVHGLGLGLGPNALRHIKG